MSKFAKITLLTLAAFLVLGFSITAYAAKPDKPQVISSAPLHGSSFWCTALNLTDHDVEITINMIGFTGAPNSTTTTRAGGRSVTWGGGGNFTIPDNVYCTVEWVGAPTDIRGSLCSFGTAAHSDGTGCLELY